MECRHARMGRGRERSEGWPNGRPTLRAPAAPPDTYCAAKCPGEVWTRKSWSEFGLVHEAGRAAWRASMPARPWGGPKSGRACTKQHSSSLTAINQTRGWVRRRPSTVPRPGPPRAPTPNHLRCPSGTCAAAQYRVGEALDSSPQRPAQPIPPSVATPQMVRGCHSSEEKTVHFAKRVRRANDTSRQTATLNHLRGIPQPPGGGQPSFPPQQNWCASGMYSALVLGWYVPHVARGHRNC
mmetsp:Transcript_19673/g.33886  ORF Transcript_19673/g.33886 Transcript_19673/m.33886 type:complete len:239 (-) Transcript_19673:153-869(-)